jgi:hypothetical protein
MQVQLNFDQRARLELLAIDAGKSAEQLLLEAAWLLLERDSADSPAELPNAQRFLSEVELEARFERLLES